MKQSVRNIILLILVVAVLAGACWFFLAYRSDVSVNVLLYWAEHYVNNGRYNRAISLYQTAAGLAPDDDRVPRLLAEAYILDGNYTKAEYTLVSAITEQPEAMELYASLSRTYLAQDKILDAEQMLASISNEDVKAQIDALRPATPVITPESGYYSEYIDISAKTASGTLYLTIDGEYPSIYEDMYYGPFPLEGGETTVMAISVGENGLVSYAAYAGYTIGNVVEEVTLEDPSVEAAIRELLGKTAADPLYSDELWAVEELVLPEQTASLADLRYLTGLKSLTLQNAASSLDLTVIGNLTTLQSLDLSGSTLSQRVLEAIGTLPDLLRLKAAGCAIDSINPLVGLTKLTELDLSNNTISDITAISSMEQLEDLRLSNNPISSISHLNNCLALRRLYIDNCGISKLSGIAGNPSLEELYASSNRISDISVLADCTALRVLDVNDNEIADISVLPSLPALANFKGNNNQITAIPVFDAETAVLVQFSANYNKITDVSGLAGLHYLNYVRVDYNAVKDISCLKGCYNLIQVDVWDNPIDQSPVSAMQDLGIIVNYNPTYKPKEA